MRASILLCVLLAATALAPLAAADIVIEYPFCDIDGPQSCGCHDVTVPFSKDIDPVKCQWA
jgi:hypothetical protein